MLTRFIWLAALSLTAAVPAQNSRERLERAYIGADGLAHVVSQTSLDKAMTKESGQVEVGTPKLSPDHRFAGWTINVENCCTSYPVPLSVAIYFSGEIVDVGGDGQMIYDWCFVASKDEVAVSTGPVHGQWDPRLMLVSAHSGKVLVRWNGKHGAHLPGWAKCLKL